MADDTIDWRKKPRKQVRKASHLLRVYRAVFKSDPPATEEARAAERPDVKLIRSVKATDPARFIAKLNDLEKEYAAMRGDEPAKTVKFDEGSRKVLDLVDELLKKIGKKAPTPPQK